MSSSCVQDPRSPVSRDPAFPPCPRAGVGALSRGEKKIMAEEREQLVWPVKGPAGVRGTFEPPRWRPRSCCRRTSCCATTPASSTRPRRCSPGPPGATGTTATGSIPAGRCPTGRPRTSATSCWSRRPTSPTPPWSGGGASAQRDPGSQPFVPARTVRCCRRSVRPGQARSLARTASPGVIRLAVESAAADPGPPPDAWKAVQRLREDVSTIEVGLNHLMFAAQSSGQGFSFGHGFTSATGSASGTASASATAAGPGEYAVPGWGGRMPVNWLGRPPQRSEREPRPVVAILDTGVGDHPWFRFGTADSGRPALALRAHRRQRRGGRGRRRREGSQRHRPAAGADRPVLRPRHVHRRPDPPDLPGRRHPVDQDDEHRRNRRGGRPAQRARLPHQRQVAALGAGERGPPTWSTSSASRSATTTSPDLAG